MTVEDNLLQLKVRATLVRNFVDTRVLSYNVIGQVVHLRGMLVVVYEHPDYDSADEHGVNARILLNIEQDLRRLPGVKDIRYDLTNWAKSGGQWLKRRYIH
jgi:hypothetical protein